MPDIVHKQLPAILICRNIQEGLKNLKHLLQGYFDRTVLFLFPLFVLLLASAVRTIFSAIRISLAIAP